MKSTFRDSQVKLMKFERRRATRSSQHEVWKGTEGEQDWFRGFSFQKDLAMVNQTGGFSLVSWVSTSASTPEMIYIFHPAFSTKFRDFWILHVRCIHVHHIKSIISFSDYNYRHVIMYVRLYTLNKWSFAIPSKDIVTIYYHLMAHSRFKI